MVTTSKATLAVAADALLAGAWAVRAQTSVEAPGARTQAPVRDIRYVVFHSPRPKWRPGRGLFEQDGLAAAYALGWTALDSLHFWASMAVSLGVAGVAGVAACPVNRWRITRGSGHAVVHAGH